MLADGMLGQGLLVDTVGLAAIALIGYLCGRRSRLAAPPRAVAEPLRNELSRAQHIADELRRLTANVGIEIASHARSIATFQTQLAAIELQAESNAWQQLRDSADKLIGPMLKVTTNLTLACGQMRRQLAQLSAFSGSRIDAASGLHNRRSLEEQLDAFFSIHSMSKGRFALAMFSVSGANCDEGGSGDERLGQTARLLEECIRDDDFVARYSPDEFVVLMPQTTLAGALAFGERLLLRAAVTQSCPVWGGIAEATRDDTAEKLLSRADSALYSARAAGGASLFVHTGSGVRRHGFDWAAAAPDPGVDAELAAAL